ncbi:MAG: hypothetical protein ACP5QO_12240 [Clostridia bacterium]
MHPYICRTTSAGHGWMLRRFTGEDGAITAVHAREARVLPYAQVRPLARGRQDVAPYGPYRPARPA